MSHAEVLSDAERTALNVFHDLELAHTRLSDDDPAAVRTPADRTPSEAPRQPVSEDGPVATPR